MAQNQASSTATTIHVLELAALTFFFALIAQLALVAPDHLPTLNQLYAAALSAALTTGYVYFRSTGTIPDAKIATNQAATTITNFLKAQSTWFILIWMALVSPTFIYAFVVYQYLGALVFLVLNVGAAIAFNKARKAQVWNKYYYSIGLLVFIAQLISIVVAPHLSQSCRTPAFCFD